MKTPAYIVLEGPDGCGKTTQMKRLQAAFTAANQPFVAVREPGATGIGKHIREILVTGHADKLDAITETFLLCADRHHNIRSLIAPSLQDGLHILSDRCYLSTYAFQGYGRGLSLTSIEDMTDLAVGTTRPNLIIIIDVPVEISLARKNIQLAATEHAAEAAENRFESIGSGFHERIRNGYHEEAKRNPETCVIIDGTQSPDAVFESIRSLLQSRLGIHI